MESFSIFAPAKLNLFLAITGRRADGFHELVSVVAPLNFGDTLRCEPAESGAFSLACDDPAVPCDESNLVLKAAALFARETGWGGGAKFFLEKRIPMGAGLGGGSSDGVAALRALDRLTGGAQMAMLPRLAAELGSDCPLFLREGPVAMRGRGERIEVLPEVAGARLRGRRVLVFKPAFAISTAWAYARLAAFANASPASAADVTAGYLPAAEAEARLGAWMDEAKAPAEALLYNNMERAAFAKFLALPALLEILRARFALAPRMSGSGSACFVLLQEDMDARPIVSAIRDAWGESAFVEDARLL